MRDRISDNRSHDLSADVQVGSMYNAYELSSRDRVTYRIIDANLIAV